MSTIPIVNYLVNLIIQLIKMNFNQLNLLNFKFFDLTLTHNTCHLAKFTSK